MLQIRPCSVAIESGGFWRTKASMLWRYLSPSAVSETPIGSWTSPVTGITYPSGWKITVPGGVLNITPLQQDQELVVAATLAGAYWEGDSTASGVIDGLPVRGVSYAEVAPVPVPGGTPLPPSATVRP